MKIFLMVGSLVASMLAPIAAQASEVSAVSGLFRNEKIKVNGADAGSRQAIDLAARYADVLSDRMHWFGEVGIGMRSYSSGPGGTSPDDSTSIGLLGGVRYYFPGFATSVVPFLSGKAGYENQKEATQAAGVWTETDRSGLVYYASAGFRMMLDRTFFLDLEADFFESYLFGTEKTETGTTKTETTRTELYADSKGSILNATIGVGMKL